jgi:hypothetical protein
LKCARKQGFQQARVLNHQKSTRPNPKHWRVYRKMRFCCAFYYYTQADLCGLIEITNHATDNELPTRTFEETVFKQKFGSKHLPFFAGV